MIGDQAAQNLLNDLGYSRVCASAYDSYTTKFRMQSDRFSHNWNETLP